VLREHRGDGHLAAVTAAGLRWPEPHLLAGGRLDPRQQELRGWTDEQWAAAQARVRELPPHLPEELERQTDLLAAQAYDGVDVEELERLLAPLARAVADAGDIPFPNAMGLLRPSAPGPGPRSSEPGTPSAGA
jgi:hypothetical protein